MKLTAAKLKVILIITIILLVIGGGVGSYFALGLVSSQIQEANHTKIDADITANAGESAARAKAELDKPEIAQLLNYANSIVPTADYRRQFLADVNKYANVTGVPLTAVTFKDVAATPGTAPSATAAAPAAIVGQAIPISLTFGSGGRYENFVAFMKKLENNLQHIQITAMTLQPESANGSILSSATLDVQLFVKK